MNPWGQPNPQAVQSCFDCFSTLSHEYVHHLDGMFNQNCIQCSAGQKEGLAEYISELSLFNFGDPRWHFIKVIGDGSDLPSALNVWNYTGPGYRYDWRHLIVRFLFEEYPQVILTLYDYFRTVSDLIRDFDHDYYWSYVNGTFPPLDDDFHRWLREFVPITTRQIEPVTIFQDEVTGAFIDFLDHFLTSQELIFGVAIFLDGMELQFVDRYYLRSEILNASLVNTETGLFIWPNATGTVEVTVIATTRDGESAEQTFTVTVVEALQTKDITVGDPVSTEEGETAINLASYFTGPALSDVELTVASNKPDVARVAVRGGRLIITAVAAGEADITLRSIYHGRQATQTFTVTITDDCPSYLCRGFFNGWRWLLLEDGQGAATETTETE